MPPFGAIQQTIATLTQPFVLLESFLTLLTSLFVVSSDGRISGYSITLTGVARLSFFNHRLGVFTKAGYKERDLAMQPT